MKKKDWEEEEEQIRKARKGKSDKKKMKVSGKSVFALQKEMAKKKQDTNNK